MQSSVAEWNLLAGWIATLAGIVSGAVMGLFFLREEWLGGYSSHPRRLLRLGHISFFGLGFTNVRQCFRFRAGQWALRCSDHVLNSVSGTPLYQRFQKSDRLLVERAWNSCTLFDINFQPDTLTVAELRSGFEALARRLYHPDFVRERSRRFLQSFRAARMQERRAA